MCLIVKEPLPLKEILASLKRRLLLHLLKSIALIGLPGPAVSATLEASPVEVFVLIFEHWHLVLVDFLT